MPLSKKQAEALAKGRRERWSSQSVEERFWAKVNVIDDETSCWEWTASRSGYPGNQYGAFYANGRIKAHRYSWILHNGPIDPPGLWVLHRCDNGLCVRPSHLFLGTRKDNVHDMWAKGRNSTIILKPVPAEKRARGSRSGNSRLTEEDIPKIRELLAEGITRAEIARRFHCDWCTIDHIRAGRTWKHIP